MSGHSAPDELLLDWATGALAPGLALAVALHVALEPVARRTAERLGDVAGALLEREAAADLDEDALDRTLARLGSVGIEPRPAPTPVRPGFEWAPPFLRPHLDLARDWRRVFGGFEEIRLALPHDRHRVSLLRLTPGRGLPMHRHVGAEFTVVLQGGYSDATGSYRVGDFAVGPGPEPHEPIADPGPPCIALIVLEEPIVLTSPWGRWLNPLVRRGLI
ncbi:MAG: cupin domain-containing protein [Alphaproteobacteria bacterium]|nr:cupin domain-containing protein [Alphaproteobacteria bacterium]